MSGTHRFSVGRDVLAAAAFVIAAQSASADIVVGLGTGAPPNVTAYANLLGATHASFFAYDASFTGGVRVAAGSLGGRSGAVDIVTGTGPGAIATVKLFDGASSATLGSLLPFGTSFTGGVYVACGDLDGDGTDEIIVGRDAGGMPTVRAFTTSGTLVRDFLAYPSGTTAGVRVASGDVNNDGIDDIITIPGPGGSPNVRVFNGSNGAILASFFAFDANFTAGAYVASGDLSGDGFDDIVVTADAGAQPMLKVFSGTNNALMISGLAYAPTMTAGVRVASGDLNGDGHADVVVVPGPGAAPTMVALNGFTGVPFGSLNVAPTTATGAYVAISGGISVCAADLNGDRVVNAADLAILLAAWASSGSADLNGSGTVDAADLSILLSEWGPC